MFLARSNNARGGTTLKVLDFGIARMVSDHQRSVTMTTAQGSMYWMSLEQSKGAHVGPYSDVWSLGLMAFKLLTGLHYWRTANQTEGATLHAWILEVAQGDYAPASQRARELGVERYLPPDFDEWVAHCVCIDVNARWANADTAFCVLSAVLQPTSQPIFQPTSQPIFQPTTQPILQPTPVELAPTHPSWQPPFGSIAPTQIASVSAASLMPRTAREPPPETSALKLIVLGAAGMSGLLILGFGVWRLFS